MLRLRRMLQRLFIPLRASFMGVSSGGNKKGRTTSFPISSGLVGRKKVLGPLALTRRNEPPKLVRRMNAASRVLFHRWAFFAHRTVTRLRQPWSAPVARGLLRSRGWALGSACYRRSAWGLVPERVESTCAGHWPRHSCVFIAFRLRVVSGECFGRARRPPPWLNTAMIRRHGCSALAEGFCRGDCNVPRLTPRCSENRLSISSGSVRC